MKVLLGALVAAALFGWGCAHEQEVPTRTEGMRSPQASGEGMALMPSLVCEVVDGAEQPQAMRNEAQTGAAPGDARDSTVIVISVPEEDAVPEEPGIGGSALEPEVAPDPAPEGVIILPTPEPEVAPDPAPEEPGIGGSALEPEVAPDPAPEGVIILPTPEPEVTPDPATKEPGIGGSAPEDDVFEDTGMGGGGGGGG